MRKEFGFRIVAQSRNFIVIIEVIEGYKLKECQFITQETKQRLQYNACMTFVCSVLIVNQIRRGFSGFFTS